MMQNNNNNPDWLVCSGGGAESMCARAEHADSGSGFGAELSSVPCCVQASYCPYMHSVLMLSVNMSLTRFIQCLFTSTGGCCCCLCEQWFEMIDISADSHVIYAGVIRITFMFMNVEFKSVFSCSLICKLAQSLMLLIISCSLRVLNKK